VWVYSEPGLGTSVKNLLAVAAFPSPVPALPRRYRLSAPSTETILLVEDEDAVFGPWRGSAAAGTATP